MSDSPRPLGFFSLTALVIANMIGAGVYTTSGYALGDLGSRGMVLLAWVVGALIAVCGAIGYGSLARQMSQSGGEYLYLSRVLHPMAGFVAGWISLIAGFTGAIALAAMTLEAYIRPATPVFSPLPTGSLATAGIVAGVAIHMFNTRGGAAIQSAIVALKVVALVLFVAIGVPKMEGAAMRPALEVAADPAMALAFATTVMWVSLSFSGFNAAIYVAGESARAAVAVPRAMLAATLLVSALYLGLNAVFLYSVPVDGIAGKPEVATIVAHAIGGAGLERAMRVIIVVSLFTSISSMVMAGPRVYAQMARDGVFPRVFAAVGAPPAVAMIFQGLLAVAVVWIAGIAELLSYLGMTLGLSALAAVGCAFVLHRNTRAGGRGRWLSLLAAGVFMVGTAVSTALSGYTRPAEFAAAALTILSGCAAYLVMDRYTRIDRGPDAERYG